MSAYRSAPPPRPLTEDQHAQMMGNSSVVEAVLMRRKEEAAARGERWDLMDVRDEQCRLMQEMRGRWTGPSGA